jgi:class 3 adenylate cyclase
MSWDTVCPHCRGVRDELDTLSQLTAHAHCEACNIDFTTDKIETVEVTFHVHSSIRDVPDVVYCSAEPARKDHIRVQIDVPGGETVKIRPNLAPGRYVAHRDHEGGWYLDIGDDGAPVVPWKMLPEGEIVKATARTEIELTNDSDRPQQFQIEQAKWSDHALRAGKLLSFQDFRDLFSAEYIGADVRLGVGEQTLLFTDVVGSTAFYASRGDPAAFIEIKKHFDEVFAIVAECRGAVVKTIGDAVMATFGSPVDAVRASHKIHQAFHPQRADTPIRLRISLNTGPCIAVRLNANADFVGGTVNIAAKLQALAEGYQIAMSESTYRATGVPELIAGANATVEDLEYTSKALPDIVKVRRWSVYSDPGSDLGSD